MAGQESNQLYHAPTTSTFSEKLTVWITQTILFAIIEIGALVHTIKKIFGSKQTSTLTTTDPAFQQHQRDFDGLTLKSKIFLSFLSSRNEQDASLEEFRARLDKGLLYQSSFQYNLEQTATTSGLPLEIVTAKVPTGAKATSKAFLYFHGGGFVAGRAHSYRIFGVELSGRLGGIPVILADYRLAPEANLLTEIFEDGLEVWNWASGRYGGSNLIVGGESAGGGMTVNVISLIISKSPNPVLPAGLVLISPFWYLSKEESAPIPFDVSLKANDIKLMHNAMMTSIGGPDILLNTNTPSYIADDSKWKGIWPPTLIIVGGSEMLVDHCLELYQKLKKVEADVELLVKPGMPHAYTLFYSVLKEASDGMDLTVKFSTSKLALKSS